MYFKKNSLGKITLVMLSVFTAVFIFTKSCDIWSANNMFDGLDNLFKYAKEYGGLTIAKFVCELFVLPIMWSVICVIYIMQIAGNKFANKSIYASTILAILVQVSCYVIDCVNVDKKISAVWVLLCIGFLLSFIMLFMVCTKELPGKILYIVLGCSLLGTVINMIVGYKTSMTVIIQELEHADFWGKVILSIYFSTPLFGVVALVLVMGYILFPKKYLEAEDKSVK